MPIAPEEVYVRERTTRARAAARVRHRDSLDEFKEVEGDGGYNAGRRRTGLRLTFTGGVPRSVWGRISTGVAAFAVLGLAWAAAMLCREMALRDGRFVLQSSSSVAIEGNRHLSRAQLLSVFGGDLEHSIFRIPLETRKAEIEEIPWIRRATVMRLLPDHLRVDVEERVPVAFVRQGGHIGLVDAGGVLLEMQREDAGQPGYSFPVVTGILPGDPISVRAARMKVLQDFRRDLDAKGGDISGKLSEVDLSDPEDVKALIPDNGADVLVHFGDSDFLNRYERFEAHLGEWRSQYPKLSAVDMRYERQVVLEMRPGTAVPMTDSGTASSAMQVGGVSPSSLERNAQFKKQAASVAHQSYASPKARPASSHPLAKAGHP